MKVYDLDAALSQPAAATELYLANRNFRQFPLDILQLTQLEVLDLSACRITELPAGIEALKRLHTLVLNGNELRDLPFALCKLPLRTLSLGANGLTEIPAVVFALPHLETLLLPDNRIEALPDSLFNQKQLKRLDVSGNQLPHLPAGISRLKALQQLRLSGNQLPALPAALFQCQKLEGLILNNNRLTKIPPGIGKLEALATLDLSGNQISALPAAIGRCKNLRRLRAHHNCLRQLPAVLGHCGQLTVLDVSRNQLSNLPDALKACSRLQELGLAANRLRKLSAFLPNLSRLSRLDVSDNRLSKWPALPLSLLSLDLSGNPLASIPAQIGKLTKLKSLHLDRTNLRRLPEAVGELQALETLTAKDVVMETLPRGLFDLHQAKQLSGLADAGKANLIMDLWQAGHETRLPGRLLKPLFDALCGQSAALSRLTVKDLFALLQIGKWEFVIRRELFGRNSGQADDGLQAGAVLSLAGETPFDGTELGIRLARQGIALASKPDRQTTHLILGRRPVFHSAFAKRGLVFIAESTLAAWLDQSEARYLACHPTPAQLENLRRLLHHGDPANLEMALRMMQGGGVPQAFHQELLNLFLHPPVSLTVSLQEMIGNLLVLNLPEDLRDGLF